MKIRLFGAILANLMRWAPTRYLVITVAILIGLLTVAGFISAIVQSI